MTETSKPTPNKEALLEWAQALESGRFIQSTGNLGFGDKGQERFCCLDMACEIFAERLGLTRLKQVNVEYTSGPYDIGYTDGKENAWMVLHSKVMNFLGLTRSDPVLCSGGWSYTATYWNDQAKSNFNEIATMIRKTYDLPPKEENRGEVQPA